VDRPGRAGGLVVVAMGYHYRRPRERSGGNPRLEIALAAFVLLVLLAVGILFLFVYHDVPLRTS
jgi:heme/copper-type cytochrome/quinol oxidase subunit 2